MSGKLADCNVLDGVDKLTSLHLCILAKNYIL
jgi:hypothetical protein